MKAVEYKQGAHFAVRIEGEGDFRRPRVQFKFLYDPVVVEHHRTVVEMLCIAAGGNVCGNDLRFGRDVRPFARRLRHVRIAAAIDVRNQ